MRRKDPHSFNTGLRSTYCVRGIVPGVGAAGVGKADWGRLSAADVLAGRTAVDKRVKMHRRLQRLLLMCREHSEGNRADELPSSGWLGGASSEKGHLS